MADNSYQPGIYRKKGALELVVASGGAITVESGGSINVQSGGTIAVSTGGYLSNTVQTVGSSATTISAHGVSLITATTLGPTYLIANPVTGVAKYLVLVPTSSGATNRAIIAPASTGVSFGTTGQNQITLATSAMRNATLIGISTAAYRVVGAFSSTMTGLGQVTT